MNMPASVSHLPASLSGHRDRGPFVPRAQGEGMGERKKFVAKGHDSQLQEAQHGRLPVKLGLVSGAVLKGTIVRRDKYTITLRHEESTAAESGQDEIFYKHAIESVLIDRRAAHDHNGQE